MRTAAIDVGNDSVKAILGPSKTQMTIPNIISPAAQERIVTEIERDVLDGLHVCISSNCLKQGKGIYTIGELARSSDTPSELRANSIKSDNDQSLILLLTTLAVDAVTSNAFSEINGCYQAHYALSTGLPIGEGTQQDRLLFKQKLESCIHEVEFLQTPLLSGKKVRIHFSKVFVNVEGISSFIFLNEHQNETGENPILIYDIGGLTSDAAIIEKSVIKNGLSESYLEGVSVYLDKIMKEVERQYQYKFKNRRDLIKVITHPDKSDRHYIYKMGNKICIQPVIETELLKLAKKQVQWVEEKWLEYPTVQSAYLVGGGASILREYIEKVLQSERKEMPLKFLDTHNSIWSNVYSYDKILDVALSNQH
ncbi:plasmid segregation protein ParM [Ureibacillus xyleni]|uniref:Plasmid segregation protein ParM n=1 Tax=Ureibacillus xyleni TaxID=614648 RepID=A0A285R8K1_9BACL|nr:ParM/StbA family protein [Ureibacillus xyleni]SOB90391.1 plasmid segregation protein ParM [Ureibacillus xyleni]